MPNTFTTVSRQGFGSRIMGAIIGVPVGIVLIFGSCILLYWNEGRTDYSKIASKSMVVQASQVDQSENGKFVSVTGSVSTNQQIGDGAYLKPSTYVAVQRTVDEYAWVQNEQTTSHSNVGGSANNTTTYTYKEEWTDNPADSSTFQYPQGHQNPPKPLNDTSVEATNAQVGAYSFDPQTIKLPTLQNVNLSSNNVTLPTPTTTVTPGTVQTTTTASSPLSDLTLASSQYIYGGSGSLTTPQVGDIRISYEALPSGTTATAFGQPNNGALGAYTDPSNHTLYDLLLGDRQTAIATLHNQYETTTWIIRGVGVGLIWLGLMMLFGPLDMLLDFIPIAGEIGGAITFIITLPIALLLGGTVIIIGYTLHHVIALLIGVPLIFAVWIGIFKLIKKARNIPKRGSGGGGSPPTAPQQPIAPYNQAPPSSSGSLFPPNNPANVQPQPSPVMPPQPAPYVQPNTYNPTPQQPVNNQGYNNPQVVTPGNQPTLENSGSYYEPPQQPPVVG
jgi:hypothetical protein